MPQPSQNRIATNQSEGGKTEIGSLVKLLRSLNSSTSFVQRTDLASFVNWKGNAAAPIHRWLRYREAYSPNLITKLRLNGDILDPFCGCGSIPIGAAERGLASVGIDVNPLAVFAARVKLTPLTKTQLGAAQTFVDGLAARLNTITPWPAPSLSITDKVFEPDILDTLLRIRALFESEFDAEKTVRNFLHLAWVAILEVVGSYFKEGNGIKYRNRKRLKDGYVKRPEGEWQLKRFGLDQKKFVVDAYLTHARMMLQDAKFWKKGRWKDQLIVEGDVLRMEQLLQGKKFRSVIFSPPYANRFDYFESMKVELWFGGFVESYEANTQLRKASLRSHLGADLNRAAEQIEPLEQLIDLMDRDASSWKMGVPSLLRGYFDDMRVTLKNCRDAAPDGKCYVVVGNSAFAGVIIPTDVFVAQLGLKCGYKKAEILVARHLTVAPQQRNLLSSLESNMRESVVVLS